MRIPRFREKKVEPKREGLPPGYFILGCGWLFLVLVDLALYETTIPFFNSLSENFLPHQPYLRFAAIGNDPEQIQPSPIDTGEFCRVRSEPLFYFL